MHIYIYVCAYNHIYMYMYIYICIHTINMYIYIHIYIFVYEYMLYNQYQCYDSKSYEKILYDTITKAILISILIWSSTWFQNSMTREFRKYPEMVLKKTMVFL